MSFGLQMSKARSASALVVEELARALGPQQEPAECMRDLGVPKSIAEDILVVKAAPKLEDYRFLYFGNGIGSRFGMNLTGQRFGILLDKSEAFLPCLMDFKAAVEKNTSISSQRRFDFSRSWIIEYSRTIAQAKNYYDFDVLVGGYVFHDETCKSILI